MKLCRVGELGKEKPAIIDNDGSYRDLSSTISDLNPESLNFATLEKIKKLNVKDLPALEANSRIGAGVKNPSKFLGIGLDVTDPDPLPDNHKLRKIKNIIITNHTSGLSDNNRLRSKNLMIENIKRFCNNMHLLNIVDKKKGY